MAAGETDPSLLAAHEADRAIFAFREVVETRLAAMDRAIILAAERLEQIPGATADASERLRAEINGAITAARELIGTRLAAMDKATELLADTVGKVPSDTDKAVAALRQLLGARIDGMDTATRLLAESVDNFPSDIDRAVSSVRELIQSQLRNVESVSKEKFSAIEGTFASNALALTAALAAQKEAAAEQNKSNTLAITKSEQATKETIAANAAQNATSNVGLVATLGDIKERVVRLEAGGTAKSTARTESRLDTAGLLQLIVTVAAVITVVIVILKK